MMVPVLPFSAEFGRRQSPGRKIGAFFIGRDMTNIDWVEFSAYAILAVVAALAACIIWGGFPI